MKRLGSRTSRFEGGALHHPWEYGGGSWLRHPVVKRKKRRTTKRRGGKKKKGKKGGYKKKRSYKKKKGAKKGGRKKKATKKKAVAKKGKLSKLHLSRAQRKSFLSTLSRVLFSAGSFSTPPEVQQGVFEHIQGGLGTPSQGTPPQMSQAQIAY